MLCLRLKGCIYVLGSLVISWPRCLEFMSYNSWWHIERSKNKLTLWPWPLTFHIRMYILCTECHHFSHLGVVWPVTSAVDLCHCNISVCGSSFNCQLWCISYLGFMRSSCLDFWNLKWCCELPYCVNTLLLVLFHCAVALHSLHGCICYQIFLSRVINVTACEVDMQLVFVLLCFLFGIW